MRTNNLTLEEEADWVVALLAWQLEMATPSGVIVDKAITVIIEQRALIEEYSTRLRGTVPVSPDVPAATIIK